MAFQASRSLINKECKLADTVYHAYTQLEIEIATEGPSLLQWINCIIMLLPKWFLLLCTRTP